MAMSVVQGGSGFQFMAPPMYKYLCGSEIPLISIEIDDIPNTRIRHLLQEVNLKQQLHCNQY